jgi:hypothetical protein
MSALYMAALLTITLGSPNASEARSYATASLSIATFATEDAAQRHCPRDLVVWLNLPTGIYHEKGMRWYGRTKHGAFVCKREADGAGDRDTRNGQ